jgi:hypothetical protein
MRLPLAICTSATRSHVLLASGRVRVGPPLACRSAAPVNDDGPEAA